MRILNGVVAAALLVLPAIAMAQTPPKVPSGPPPAAGQQQGNKPTDAAPGQPQQRGAPATPTPGAPAAK